MWLFLRRAGGADVKFHADRRNFCRRVYILCMKRTITVSIVRSCTVKSRSPAQRKLHNLFVYGRSQTAGYLLEQSPERTDRPTFTMRRIFFHHPLYRTFTTTKFADRWNHPRGELLDREEKKSPSDRKQPAPLFAFFTLHHYLAVIWIQKFGLEMDWNRAKSLFI